MEKVIIILIIFVLIVSCKQTNSDSIKDTVKEEKKVVTAKKKYSFVDTGVVRQNIENGKMKWAEKQKERLQRFKNELQVDSIDNKPIDFYLNNNQIDTLLIDFYNGGFLPSDDEKTLSLLKILTQKNDNLFPFYFHCFNQICEISDGALSEMMGNNCFKIVYNYPKYSFNYFRTDSIILDKYSRLIGYEMYFIDYGKSNFDMSYDDFKKYLNVNLDLKNQTINKAYQDFINGIDKTIKNMN